MFYWNIVNVDEIDFEVERTDVDRVLPVLQCLRHYEGVDVRSVLPVLIVLQRFEPKYITLHHTSPNCVNAEHARLSPSMHYDN